MAKISAYIIRPEYQAAGAAFQVDGFHRAAAPAVNYQVLPQGSLVYRDPAVAQSPAAWVAAASLQVQRALFVSDS